MLLGQIVSYFSRHAFSLRHSEKLEKWLKSPPKMTGKQHETEKLRSPGTGEWAFKHRKLIDWMSNPGVLWVEGPCKSISNNQFPV
jgi:hypothetical protein